MSTSESARPPAAAAAGAPPHTSPAERAEPMVEPMVEEATPPQSASGAAAGRGDRSRSGRGRRAPLPLSAAVAAGWAALVSYGAVLVLTAAGLAGSGTGAVGGMPRLAATIWLLSHGVALEMPTGRVTLVPLALSALAAWRVARAGVHASRAHGGQHSRSVGRPLAAAGAVAVAYLVLGVVTAALVRTPELDIAMWSTGVRMGAFGGVFAMLGAVRHSRAGRGVGRRIPLVVRDAVRCGFVAAVLVLAAGAGLAGIGLAVRGGAAAEMLGSYQAGLLGQAGITLLCLAYVPNLAAWGAAYLVGPGFMVGAGTVVSPGEVRVGPVPAVPVFAALPTGPLPGVGPVLLAIPLAAGVCAGLLLMRRRRTAWRSLVQAAALSGPVAGLVLLAAGYVSAGALGAGRLSTLGPVSWWVGGIGALLAGTGCVLAAVGRAAAVTAAAGPNRSLPPPGGAT